MVRFLRNVGWRPVASYFLLFLVFFILVQLYSLNSLNIWGAGALAFSCSALLAWIMYSRIIAPLEEVASVAQDMARGNLDQEIRISSQDEIGDLARSINYLARQLKNNIEDVIAEKNRIKAILSSMSDGVIAMDAWGRMILINPVVEELFRITMAASRGKNILRVIRNYDLEKLLNQALETGRCMQKQIQILAPEPRVFQVHVIPLQNSGAERGGVVALLRDITERKILQEMRSEFVANVSHELRTPLTSIRGFAETLLDGALEEPDTARRFLEIINSETERLSRLIDELLNLSRLESHKWVPKRQPVNMGELIKRAVAILQPRAVEKNLAIKINLPEDLPVVQGDPDMLSQVLLNLIENAVVYTQAGGEVSISAAATQDEMKVDVKDNGIGIPPESLSRVFERFYRVDKARSREQGGTGLGLSIVKHIIDAHRGSVQVESKVGIGSTFSFVIPLEHQAASEDFS
ncbi:MAG: phosphate regulon sensor histidine kinase PhoR [Pelotomaculum sp.]|nr:phosphate regulon sensor histidine kinase PhoR [Pelotomaculum sp.]